MEERDDQELAWFMRVATAVLRSPQIMDDASATDWRVLLTICQHQGWKKGPRYRKTFRLSVDRTAEEACCSRRTALRSISWWCKMGALRKTKDQRMNVYEIVDTLPPSSGIGAKPRHNTPRNPKRGDHGQYVPSVGTRKVPAHGTDTVPAHGTPNQKSLSEIFNENPPPPPTGGNGRLSETSARPSHIISDDTIKALLKIKNKEQVLDLLKKGNYPIPAVLLEGQYEE
jgi:hypothetical protein